VTIAQYPGGTIEELRRAIHLSHAATVRIVDRLVARGLVRRRSGARGPAVALSTTSDGKRMAREILATRKRILESVLPPLSDEEAATLTTVLERMLVRLAEEPARSASICRLCDSACRRHRCPVAETQRAIGRTVPDPVPLESNE
jgi:MarR family transcriptional repressor of emrRAB